MSTPSSCIARTSSVPVTARPSGVVLKYVLPAVVMWNAPHCSAIRPSCTSSSRQSTRRASSAPYSLARSGTPAQVGLVGLAEVGGVGVGDRALLAHPRHRGRGVEPARERDADALADRQATSSTCRHRRRSYRCRIAGSIGIGGVVAGCIGAPPTAVGVDAVDIPLSEAIDTSRAAAPISSTTRAEDPPRSTDADGGHGAAPSTPIQGS